MEPIKPGSVVKSLSGRDRDTLYLVVGAQTKEGFVALLLADGKYRPTKSPKSKNPIHLQTMCAPDERIATAIADGTLTDAQIRKVLKAHQFQV